MQLSSKQVLALKRKRGERNLTIDELANEVGTSRFTISRILHNSSQNLTSTTVKKINDWIIDQYTTIN
ncbi:helix-turn-helix domain-containing protein [Lactobacillus helveticus]|uniref:helix-turn-helix domain-containing protein n=1 Tax=Lactobacillus helveticus TaxID=1587 RepID=UPI0013FD140B|nr:helix-turn-helix transcriptional regulator [Lactobacillus helveticus]MCI7715266.1 helix-turn-helix domain-containing protein [Lactobacillus johnsonii]NHL84246.1 XRE family transcriptional regulator [Lactobacillus helveticus]NHL96406.1 XRE family transcriptional regulator [Lactobacillus helveticus]